MTQIDDINKAIEEGMKKARLIAYQAIRAAMRNCARELVIQAVNDYNGGNLTGNTITSICAGIYEEGVPAPEILTAMEVVGLSSPIDRKLRKDETFIGEDYDGRERSGFKADIDTDGDYGEGTSFHILNNYRLPQGVSFGIVVTTGTEYSEYLTKTLDYDVLISTFKQAPSIAEKEWKKVKVNMTA